MGHCHTQSCCKLRAKWGDTYGVLGGGGMIRKSLWGCNPRNWRMRRCWEKHREQHVQRPHGGKVWWKGGMRVWCNSLGTGGWGRRPQKELEGWGLASSRTTILLLYGQVAALGGRAGPFQPRGIVTSSVLASIFLWVRASRRMEGWTPRSWKNGNQNAIQWLDLTFANV